MIELVKKSKAIQIILFVSLSAALGLLFFVLAELPIEVWWLVILGIFFPFTLLIAGNVRHLLMSGLVLLMPLHIDMNFYHTFEEQAGAHTMGVSAVDIFALMLFFLLILELAGKRKTTFYFYPRLAIPTILYIEVCVLTLLWAPRMDLAVMQIYTMLKLFFLFLVLANHIRDVQDIRLLAWALAFIVGLQSFIGVLQMIKGGTLGLAFFGEPVIREEGAGPWRVMGTLGHPNRLGMFLEILLPMCFALFLIEKQKLMRFFAISVFGLGIVALIMTGSRGAWVSFTFALAILFYFAIKSKAMRFSSLIGPGIAALILITIMTFAFSDMIEERLYGEDHGSAMSRIPMMQIAFNLIQDHPIGGVGINNYAEVMQQYNDTILGRRFGTIPRPVHNMYLLVIGETGLLGFGMLLSMMIMFGATLLKSIKSENRTISLINIALLAGLGAMCVHGMVDKHPPGGYIYFYVMMAIAASSYYIVYKNNTGKLMTENPDNLRQ